MAAQIALQQPISASLFPSSSSSSSFSPSPLPSLIPAIASVPWRFFATADQPEHRYPFCHDIEGWGPASKLRWDVTPCFLDASFLGFAVVSILGGAFGLRAVLGHTALPVKKNLHFYAKLTTIVLLGITLVSSALFDLISAGPSVLTDVRFWTPVALTASLCLVFAIQYAEHARLRYPFGPVLFYWLLLLIAYFVKFHSAYARHAFRTDLVPSILLCVSGFLVFLSLVLEWLIPKQKSEFDALGDKDECPYQYANVFSVLTFSWITPLMRLGYRKYLTADDLWNLRPNDSTVVTEGEFQRHWNDQLKRKKPSIWKAIVLSIWRKYTLGAGFKVLSDILQFLQPQLLRALISFVSHYQASPKSSSVFEGVVIACSMFAISVVQVLCLHQYFQHSFETGMRVRSALTAAVYRKSLRLSTVWQSDDSTGKIINLMALDAQRIDGAFRMGQMIWSGPFQITLAVVSLFHLIGFSMFAGLGAVVIMVPLNWVISRVMKRLNKQQMTYRDNRVRLVAEILNNMKSIKLHAWGPAFREKLNHLRNNLELVALRKVGMCLALQNFSWATSPFLVSCFSFGAFVLLAGGKLSVDIVFPALALFNLITFPLSVIPMVITAWIESSVSAERIREFLLAPEVQVDAVREITNDEFKRDGLSVQVKSATFQWLKETETPVLQDVSFSVEPGELVCVIGLVGCGKTSLLRALLGDLWRSEGSVSIRGSVAYVAQTSWIMNGTVRSNILFEKPYNKERYRRTLEVCALKQDLATLPQGDMSLVGERGLSLSGGQKARVALARAVYADADVYILDDVLSAVDPHVAQHLMDNVLGNTGVLAGKARILTTNYMPVLRDAQLIMLLKDGRVHEHGTLQQLAEMRGEAWTYIETVVQQAEAAREIDDELIESMGSSDTESGGGTDLAPIRGGEFGPERKRRHSSASHQSHQTRTSGASQRDVEATHPGEVTQTGSVSMEVYRDYTRMSSPGGVFFYFLFLFAAQTVSVSTNLWLKRWAEQSESTGGEDAPRQLLIYASLGIGAAILTCGQSLVLWLGCSLVASKAMHSLLTNAVFRAPMSFFETNPSGRILNRFTGDIGRVDGILPRSFNMLFSSTCRSFASMAVISLATPVFTVFIVPLGLIYYFVQRYFLHTSREIRRLDSATLSPIHDHFQETLTGQSTIRAFKQQDAFLDINAVRVDAHIRTTFASMSTNRWLGVRLEFIGTIVILLSALLSVVSLASGHGPSAGMVGLAISYALQITNSLNWIVRQSSEVETNLVSVERILEYAKIKPEADEVVDSSRRPQPAWPAHGDIRFENYSTRYRPDLNLALRDVNLHIKPGEKIGVVGRTGAGKSSLTMALFRIIEADMTVMGANGKPPRIVIDGVDIAKIGLQDLRSRLAIIPQDSSLFHGSVRDNLDPCGVHDDTELWSVLKAARLQEHVNSMDGKLSAPVGEGGANLSHGQRQLISLARALLVPTTILVLDEATSSVDIHTDHLIQQTLRSPEMQDRTVITIAHRLNTVLDSDRIVVLDEGRVAECGSPRELVAQKGMFYDLIQDANLLSQVEGVAADWERDWDQDGDRA